MFTSNAGICIHPPSPRTDKQVCRPSFGELSGSDFRRYTDPLKSIGTRRDCCWRRVSFFDRQASKKTHSKVKNAEQFDEVKCACVSKWNKLKSVFKLPF